MEIRVGDKIATINIKPEYVHAIMITNDGALAFRAYTLSECDGQIYSYPHESFVHESMQIWGCLVDDTDNVYMFGEVQAKEMAYIIEGNIRSIINDFYPQAEGIDIQIIRLQLKWKEAE